MNATYAQRRFEHYSAFVALHLSQDEPAESFDRWDRYVLVTRHLRYCASFFDDVIAVANTLLDMSGRPGTSQPLEITIESGRDLVRAHDTVAGLLGDAVSRCDPAISATLAFMKARLRSAGSFEECRLDKSGRRLALASYLSRVIDRRLIPSFYDIDHLQDIVPIIRSRYCCGPGEDSNFRFAIDLIAHLCKVPVAADRLDEARLQQAVTDTMGASTLFQPKRYTDTSDDAFHFEVTVSDAPLGVDATADYDAYLRLNEQYSLARRRATGDFDRREISLFRGNELNHRATVRLIISLLKRGELDPTDEVLVIGSRHRDEIVFFRDVLGLERTVGLDLFEDPGYIEKGDMHRMHYKEDRFSLVYTAGTLSYSYNVRLVIDEMARVCKKPGYVIVIDAADRWRGPTPIARTELMNAETIRRLFFKYKFETVLFDDGRSMVPHFEEHQGANCYRKYPSVGVRIHGLKSEARRDTNTIR